MTADQRLALAEEASSLPLHVQMCAMRHEQTMNKIDQSITQMRLIETQTMLRLQRIERAAWAILGTIGTGGVIGITQVLPALQILLGN